MDTSSVAYVLCRIEDDSSLTPVSEHEDILTGIAAGGYAVEVEDLEFAYALYLGDPSNGFSTRPLEKSAPDFEDTSIYCLSQSWVKWLRFIADSSLSAVMGAR